MTVIIRKKGQPDVQLIAQVTPCQPSIGDWPFPGDKHINNPVTNLCIRCGVSLPKGYAGYGPMVVPDSMKKLKKEVGL